MTGDAYLARLKRLRADLAENEAAFKAQDYPIKVETIQCPNCGGILELGMDKCEYCGQVVLSSSRTMVPLHKRETAFCLKCGFLHNGTVSKDARFTEY